MRSYSFKDLSTTTLAEVADIRHEPVQPELWEELARRPLGDHERAALGFIVEKLLYYKTTRVNEATIWSRAIYPLLALAERGGIRAWSMVPLVARFADVELRGEADGALAGSIDEELGLPYLVVVEAKRGIGATDPVAQLFGAMLCAARLNEQGGQADRRVYGCYTVADVWTFVRGRMDWSGPQAVMTVLSSREYTEKTEAATILSILASIVAEAQG